MADYAELVKSLRYVAENHSTTSPEILTDAADAIEELSKVADAVNDAHNEGYDVGYWAGRRDYEPKWIPVTERLPRKGQIVCVSDGMKTWDYGRFRRMFKDNPTRWIWKGQTVRTVKWWMLKEEALPTPPKEETE